jgi:hypothetical protein
MAEELQRLRREEARLASCRERFENNSAWTLTVAEAGAVLGCTGKEIAQLVRKPTVWTVWGQKLRKNSARRIPRSELRRYLEEELVRLRDDFVHSVEQIVLPGFNSLRWRMHHGDLSTAAAAKRLEVSPRKVLKLINDGPLHAARSSGGRCEMISPFEVEEFKKAHGELLSAGHRAA